MLFYEWLFNIHLLKSNKFKPKKIMKKSSMLLKGVFTLLFLTIISFSSNASTKGKVKFFNDAKGFGIVTDMETGIDSEFTIEPGADIQIGEEVIIITITNHDGELKTKVVQTKMFSKWDEYVRG
jgi:hypothetical protein